MRTTDAEGLSFEKTFELTVNDVDEIIQRWITSKDFPIRHKGGEEIVVPIAYSTIDGTSDQALSFNVHFDSSLFAFDPSAGVTGERSENLLQLGAVQDDALDLDGDPSTDRYILITIAALPDDIPSNADPVKLADLIFTAADLPIDPVTGLKESSINFSQTDSVPGHTFASTSALLHPFQFSLDVDQDGDVTALGDGLMIIRHLFGPAFAGDALTNKAISPDATRTTQEIHDYIQSGIDGGFLDVDRDGQTTALGDGLMIIRNLFGAAFAGNALVSKAINPVSPYFGEDNAWEMVAANIDALIP